MSTMSLMGAATRLAERGFHILPCWPDTANGHKAKSPIGPLVPPVYAADRRTIIEPGGKSKATRDPATIVQWWRRQPTAMIGAVVPRNLLVLDFDPYHGGTVQALETAIGQHLPPTVTVVSGRGDGSEHRYFQFNYPFDPTQVNLPTGIDIRKAGRNYMIMPPSIHPATGRPYQWRTDCSRYAALPTPLISLLQPRNTTPLPIGIAPTVTDSRVAGIVGKVAAARDGDRNACLFWAACTLTEIGALDGNRAALQHAAESTGLMPREVETTIDKAQVKILSRAVLAR